ncbi:SpoIIE family protein phosphatase [Limibacter armeniacum]|uniref:SpoIIE family protein phosphatase n=1 Tax=Limibacter armeniacum TaxID=466084 RepID=UPI002FE52972
MATYINTNSFERKVLNFSAITTSFFSALAIIYDLLYGEGNIVVFMFTFNAICNFTFVLTAKGQLSEKTVIGFFIFNGIFALYAWYAFGNIENLCNMCGLLMATQVRVVLNHNVKVVNVLSISFAILLTFLHIIAIVYPSYIPTVNRELVFFNLGGMFVTYTFITLAIKHYSQKVMEERKTVQQQQEELAVQNEELQVNNEELISNQEEISAQREKIGRQHNELQRANNDLLNSINYANHIQTALFSSSIEKLDREKSFVINMPKDIVSGDFCFVREVGNVTYIVQGDCTGHGVPGAILTVIATEILDKVIVDKKNWSPKEILTELDNEMEKRLRQKGRMNLDGLEAGILAIDNKVHVALYAGAKRPLIYWNSDGRSFEIVKGTKKAVGNVMNVENEYREHIFKVRSGDRFYLFTDGYVDQFGGKNNKKYSSKRFLKTITELSDTGILEQAEILTDEFNNWKGNKRQIDDVMVLGIEV